MKELVWEFYSNSEIIDGVIKTYVRGTHISEDEDYIMEMRALPRVPRPTYPPRKSVVMDMVGVELAGLGIFSWVGQRFLRQGELNDIYKMLNLIVVSDLAPIGRQNEILLGMARLLYAIGMGHNINLPTLILMVMMKWCDVKRNSLPFGTLVMEMC